MLWLIKQLLHRSSINPVGESYLQILDSGEKNFSFILHLDSLEESEQMLLALIQIQHTRNCRITASQSKETDTDIIVDISSCKKRNNQEVYKLIVFILNKQEEIKSNGKNNREA